MGICYFWSRHDTEQRLQMDTSADTKSALILPREPC